jgi:ATP-dependent RNA helicase RhlE
MMQRIRENKDKQGGSGRGARNGNGASAGGQQARNGDGNGRGRAKPQQPNGAPVRAARPANGARNGQNGNVNGQNGNVNGQNGNGQPRQQAQRPPRDEAQRPPRDEERQPREGAHNSRSPFVIREAANRNNDGQPDPLRTSVDSMAKNGRRGGGRPNRTGGGGVGPRGPGNPARTFGR